MIRDEGRKEANEHLDYFGNGGVQGLADYTVGKIRSCSTALFMDFECERSLTAVSD